VAYTHENKEHRAALLAGLQSMKAGDFVLTSNWGVNGIIQYGSQCPFGHAILYLGIQKKSHTFMELPLVKANPSAMFAADGVDRAAFVHCKKISDGKRQAIVDYALAYHAAKKGNWKNSYDMGVAVQGVVSVVFGNTVGGMVGLVSEDAERSMRNLAEAPMAIANEAITAFTDYPALGCSGLITWSHYKGAGHVIDKSYLSTPHTSSPRSLWDAVKSAHGRFGYAIYEFN
jgi:hypothetical protein